MGTDVRELRAVPALPPEPSPSTAELDRIGVDGALATLPSLPGVTRASDLAPATDNGVKDLVLAPDLRRLFPTGSLRRGTIVAVTASTPGLATLLLAMLAGPIARGAWAAIVGGPGIISAQALLEHGIDPHRLAFIPEPGAHAAEVVSALIDGLDIIAVHAPAGLGSASRRLIAKARQAGAVLVPYGAAPDRQRNRADVTLQVTGSHWKGLGQGRGRLRHHTITVSSHAHGRPRTATLAFGEPLSAHEQTPTLAPVVPITRARKATTGPRELGPNLLRGPWHPTDPTDP
ncbi:hypothetical protein AB0I28_32605 [Phytomonospora sp. NPDC050363]|uniref:hypothetical protein n=1 Tax=Phytomonospora sp. NPDC050363 TaxID=3155642 RepID=UPI0033DC3FF5